MSWMLQPFEREMNPEFINKVKVDFTEEFFFNMIVTKELLKDSLWDTLTEEYQRHMKEYLSYFMNTREKHSYFQRLSIKE